MRARVAVAQLDAQAPRGAVTAQAVAAVGAAAAAGADVLVLPEYASGWAPRLHPELAEVESGEFVTAVRGAAAGAGIVVVVGVLVPRATAGRARNLTLVIGADGAVLGQYAKVHLYDAYGARESDLLDAGPPGAPLVVDLPLAWGGSLRLGVVTCYDLRFPESIRALVDCADDDDADAPRPVDLIAVGAAWAAGEGKSDQLRVLARARAIENTAYVALASQSGAGRVGGSAVIDPRGVVLAQCPAEDTGFPPLGPGASPELAVAEVDSQVLAQVRVASPVLRHRRYRVVAAD